MSLWAYLIFFLTLMRAQPSNGVPKIFNFWGEEKWRQAKLAREFLLASPFRRGTVATMTTTACRDLIRMRIMISNINGYGRKYLLYHSRFVFKWHRDMVCDNHVYGHVMSMFVGA